MAGSRLNSAKEIENNRIGRTAKKRYLTLTDKARKQDADMHDCARRRVAAVQVSPHLTYAPLKVSATHSARHPEVLASSASLEGWMR
jgi:hypothetical protein